jgi:hypothetical protein
MPQKDGQTGGQTDAQTGAQTGAQSGAQTGAGPFENAGRTVDEHMSDFGERFEQEVRRVITYLNNQVVPEVRENGSKALRVAAGQLTRLADHLESRRGN